MDELYKTLPYYHLTIPDIDITTSHIWAIEDITILPLLIPDINIATSHGWPIYKTG